MPPKTRSVAAKGWAKKAPGKKSTRAKKLAACGTSCFLQPGRLAYPICPVGSCEPSCAGLTAAYARARQRKSNVVAAKAKAKRKALCGK